MAAISNIFLQNQSGADIKNVIQSAGTGIVVKVGAEPNVTYATQTGSITVQTEDGTVSKTITLTQDPMAMYLTANSGSVHKHGLSMMSDTTAQSANASAVSFQTNYLYTNAHYIYVVLNSVSDSSVTAAALGNASMAAYQEDASKPARSTTFTQVNFDSGVKVWKVENINSTSEGHYKFTLPLVANTSGDSTVQYSYTIFVSDRNDLQSMAAVSDYCKQNYTITQSAASKAIATSTDANDNEMEIPADGTAASFSVDANTSWKVSD